MKKEELSMLQDLTAAVTGGGSGIGKAVALALARQGVYVIVNDLNSETAQSVVAEIISGGGQAYAWPHDVTKEDTTQSLTETIKKTTGKLHILVNNAGGGPGSAAKFLDISPANWDTMVRLNLNSVYYCCQAAIPFMLKNNYGRIINISSAAGLRGGGMKGTSGYAAVKAGVIGLTKGLAREYARQGICAVAIAPGMHETAAHATLSAEEKRDFYARVPMNVAGDPVDLAEIVAFIASSPHTKYLTGAVIAVDGGLTMH
jgi:3-oxoacyl-[acyl-carrier protein] reductase